MINHYEEFNTPLDRKEYNTRLEKLLGFKYGKDIAAARRASEQLVPMAQEAIRNSEKVHSSFYEYSPARSEPCTTVYLQAKTICSAAG